MAMTISFCGLSSHVDRHHREPALTLTRARVETERDQLVSERQIRERLVRDHERLLVVTD
jgi:hypothetical protein